MNEFHGLNFDFTTLIMDGELQNSYEHYVDHNLYQKVLVQQHLQLVAL